MCSLSKPSMDTFGHHPCVCPVKGDRIKRHNVICDILFEFCSAGAWGPVTEKLFLFPGSSERPAGIFIPNYSGGKNLFVDVAVTCLCSISMLWMLCKLLVILAMTMPMKWNQKTLKQEFMKKAPFFESFGGFSRDLPIFFSKLINSVSLRYDDLRCITSKHLYESLSCALMKSIARSITSRFPEYFRSV